MQKHASRFYKRYLDVFSPMFDMTLKYRYNTSNLKTDLEIKTVLRDRNLNNFDCRVRCANRLFKIAHLELGNK